MHNPRDSGAQAYLPLTYPDYLLATAINNQCLLKECWSNDFEATDGHLKPVPARGN